jgi:hypothetical protein
LKKKRKKKQMTPRKRTKKTTGSRGKKDKAASHISRRKKGAGKNVRRIIGKDSYKRQRDEENKVLKDDPVYDDDDLQGVKDLFVLSVMKKTNDENYIDSDGNITEFGRGAVQGYKMATNGINPRSAMMYGSIGSLLGVGLGAIAHKEMTKENIVLSGNYSQTLKKILNYTLDYEWKLENPTSDGKHSKTDDIRYIKEFIQRERRVGERNWINHFNNYTGREESFKKLLLNDLEFTHLLGYFAAKTLKIEDLKDVIERRLEIYKEMNISIPNVPSDDGEHHETDP